MDSLKPEDGGGPFEYSYEYPAGVNGTNATMAVGTNTTAPDGLNMNSTSTNAAVGVDSAAIPYAGSVSFLYRNRRQKRRILRRR